MLTADETRPHEHRLHAAHRRAMLEQARELRAVHSEEFAFFEGRVSRLTARSRS